MKRPLLAVLALSLLGACGDEDRTGTEGTPANDRSSVAPASLSFALLPPIGESVVGRVDVTAKGRSSTVAVWLGEGRSRTSYDGAIRLGSCESLGATVASLVPATADSAGVGRAQSDISIPLDSLMKTPMALVYGVGGRPATCGRIPARMPG